MKPLLVNSSSQRMPKKFLEKCIRVFGRELRKQKIRHSHELALEIVIVWLDRRPARKMNLQFRGKNYATDVLSFQGDQSQLGEIILCPQVIGGQARAHQLSFNTELAYLVLHGILHLLGYDHEGSARAAREMFRLQDEIFAAAAKKLNLDW